MEGDIGWVRLLSSRPAALSECPGGLGRGSAVPEQVQRRGLDGGVGAVSPPRAPAPPGLPPPPPWPRPSSQMGLAQSPAQRRTRGDRPALFSHLPDAQWNSPVTRPPSKPCTEELTSLCPIPVPMTRYGRVGRAATVPVAQVRNQAQSGQGAAKDLGPARADGQWPWPGRPSREDGPRLALLSSAWIRALREWTRGQNGHDPPEGPHLAPVPRRRPSRRLWVTTTWNPAPTPVDVPWTCANGLCLRPQAHVCAVTPVPRGRASSSPFRQLSTPVCGGDRARRAEAQPEPAWHGRRPGTGEHSPSGFSGHPAAPPPGPVLENGGVPGGIRAGVDTFGTTVGQASCSALRPCSRGRWPAPGGVSTV